MYPKRIILIRHGQSEGNVDKLIYGQKPDYALNLTRVGVEQATLAGQQLKKLIGDETLGVYYSPFFRTIETLNHVGKSVRNNIIFTREEPRIREQEWHGRIPIGYDEDYSTQLELERDNHGTFFFRFDGGESCADVYDRVSDFLNTLHRDSQKRFGTPENVLLVMHGMTNRVFLMRWFHKTIAEFETWENPHNCEMFILNHNSDTNKYDFDFSNIRTHGVLHPYRCKLEI